MVMIDDGPSCPSCGERHGCGCGLPERRTAADDQWDEMHAVTAEQAYREGRMETISLEEMERRLEVQVGGSHYKRWKIQPVELWAAKRYDAFIGAALKYILRWKDKGGVEDLDKAVHYIELREELEVDYKSPETDAIPINRFCWDNGLDPITSIAVIMLDGYSGGLLPASAAISAIKAMRPAEA